jgi:hypothetical protein
MTELPPGSRRQRVRRQSVELTVEGFRRAIAQIGRTLGPDDDWDPVLLLECRGDERVVVPLTDLFRAEFDPLGKDVAAEAMPWLIRELDAWLAAFVSTAWSVRAEREEYELEPDGTTLRRGLQPSEHPDRIEIVLLVVCGENEEDEQFHQAEIVRRPDRPPALRPWEFIGREGAMGGRFGNALRAGFGREPVNPSEEENR